MLQFLKPASIQETNAPEQCQGVRFSHKSHMSANGKHVKPETTVSEKIRFVKTIEITDFRMSHRQSQRPSS